VKGQLSVAVCCGLTSARAFIFALVCVFLPISTQVARRKKAPGFGFFSLDASGLGILCASNMAIWLFWSNFSHQTLYKMWPQAESKRLVTTATPPRARLFVALALTTPSQCLAALQRQFVSSRPRSGGVEPLMRYCEGCSVMAVRHGTPAARTRK